MLTVTLRRGPTPHSSIWQLIAKIPISRILSVVTQIYSTRVILFNIKGRFKQTKTPFPDHFRFIEF